MLNLAYAVSVAAAQKSSDVFAHEGLHQHHMVRIRAGLDRGFVASAGSRAAAASSGQVMQGRTRKPPSERPGE